MSASGKIAIITLVRSSEDVELSSEELAERIRRDVEASKLRESWIIDKVTVLDESPSRATLVQPDRSRGT